VSGKAAFLAAFAGSLSLIATSAATAAGEVRLSPDDIAVIAKNGAGPGTSGLPGIRTTVLYGDPAAPGEYAIEIRVPPHTRIAAHTHRDDRSAVVVSGRWFFGYGAQATRDGVKPLPPGSFYTEPAGSPHFALTRDEPAVVYITGRGPTDTHFIEAR
jgi:quercetin dioxygenase-like cupin family protein